MAIEPLPCNLKAQDRPGGCDPPRIVELLSDDEIREIFMACEEPTTAKQIMTEHDIPTRSVYRKLEQLEHAGMISSVTVDPSSGAIQYMKTMGCISITYDDPIQIEYDKNELSLYCEI